MEPGSYILITHDGVELRANVRGEMITDVGDYLIIDDGFEFVGIERSDIPSIISDDMVSLGKFRSVIDVSRDIVYHVPINKLSALVDVSASSGRPIQDDEEESLVEETVEKTSKEIIEETEKEIAETVENNPSVIDTVVVDPVSNGVFTAENETSVSAKEPDAPALPREKPMRQPRTLPAQPVRRGQRRK